MQRPELTPEEMKEITGFSTNEEYHAYEKGREDEQEVMMKFIENWDGSTNSAAGELLDKKFKQYKKQELCKKISYMSRNSQ